tara:strand:+ start:2519 stop:3502 length:984 start_codon:yes stop_codon:yes gene_type:complete
MEGIWMLFLLMLFSCISDNLLVHEVVKETFVEVEVECEDTGECVTEVIEEIIVIEDTAIDLTDIWVDSFVQPTSVNGVDILWVIDPSGSMNQHQTNLINGIGAMMHALPATGWRLAIMSSDWRFSEQEQQFPLVPGDTVQMAESMYHSSNIGAYEAGFDAVYGYVMQNPYAATWLRNDAALLIVFVSDEPEQSTKYLTSTTEFISWLSAYRTNAYVASIVNIDPPESLCNGNGNNTGHEYIDVANHFNGQVVDICAEDWTAGVAQAAIQTEPYESITLTHLPLHQDYIFVFIDGVPNYDWYYDASDNTVYFDVIPPANSLVEVAYNY